MTSAIQKLIEWKAGDPEYFWSVKSLNDGAIGLTMMVGYRKVDWVFTKVELLESRCDVLSMKVDELAVSLADHSCGECEAEG